MGIPLDTFLESGKIRGLSDLACAVHIDPSYIGQHLNLTLLAPDLIEMILRGEEPTGLSLGRLMKEMPLE